MVLGGSSQAGLLTQGIAPALVDALLLRIGFRSQRTMQPKTNAPDNLFQPLEEMDHVEGSLSDQARSTSLAAWLEMHPSVKRPAAETLLGMASLLAARAA